MRYIFCLTSNRLKTFKESQHNEDANFALNIVGHQRINQSHIRPLFSNNSSTFVYGPMKICMNANIMKTQYMT